MGGVNQYSLARLRSGIRPLRLHWFSRLDSTNDQAARMRRRHQLYAPALVLAGAQVAGRGRGDNAWWSCPGSITATLVFPVHERFGPHQLPLVVGLAVRNAVAAITHQPAIELKWPNDLLFRGRKLAGVLCERLGGVDLIGVGLNVNIAPPDAPPLLRPRITSLQQIAGREYDKTDVLCAIVAQVYPVLSRRDEFPFAAVLREYDQHHALRGRRVRVTIHRNGRPIRGTCTGLDSMGRLLVRDLGSHQHRIVAGHVQLQ